MGGGGFWISPSPQFIFKVGGGRTVGGGVLDHIQSPVHLQGRWGQWWVLLALTHFSVHFQGRWGAGMGGVAGSNKFSFHFQGRCVCVCVCWISPSPPFIFKVGGDGGGDSGSHQVLRSSSR